MGILFEQYGWDQQKIADFRATLLSWYDEHQRDLPWRRDNNPYYIWVSEIMLQQTKVNTVIPYFERFINQLPTIADLAKVEESELMQLWAGLGYYSRARNLKVAAQQIMTEFNGKMPNTIDELLTLKGVGSYTAAAIGSMAFGIAEPAIDGNLLRVTARLFEIDADISNAKERKIFTQILRELIDPHRPGDFNQALMDIGSQIMTPTNYYPTDSPLKDFDQSYLNETAQFYPVKKKKVKQTHHYLLAYLVENEQSQWLYRKHASDELLADLWHFPMFEYEIDWQEASDDEILAPLYQFLEQQGVSDLSLAVVRQQGMISEMPLVKHVFTHRVWHIQRILVKYDGKENWATNDLVWCDRSSVAIQLPTSTLQKKLEK